MSVVRRFLGILFLSLSVLLGLLMSLLLPVDLKVRLLMCVAVAIATELTVRQLRRDRADETSGPTNGGEPTKESA